MIIVAVAFVGKSAEELLLALESEFSQDAIFHINIEAFNGISDLHELLRLDRPG